MQLADLLTIDRIRIPLAGGTKSALLAELVSIVAADDGVGDREIVLRAVLDREAILSTGIGHGVAIPHGKSAVVPELRMAAGRTTAPVDFDSLDGQPVQLLFLLIGPESAAGPHIKALSRISRLVRREDVRERLVLANSAGEFLQALREAEA